MHTNNATRTATTTQHIGTHATQCYLRKLVITTKSNNITHFTTVTGRSNATSLLFQNSASQKILCSAKVDGEKISAVQVDKTKIPCSTKVNGNKFSSVHIIKIK